MNWLSKSKVLLSRQKIATGVALSACLFSSFAVNAELYKYINSDGITVLDGIVPAQFINNGYTVLSDDGRVIEVVPRALTEDEIIVRDKQLAIDSRIAEEKEKRAEADRNLMRIYSNPEDVVRARDTKIASVEGFIRSSESNLNRLMSQKRALEKQFANIERAGGVISKAKFDQMKTLQSRILLSETEINLKRSEIRDLETAYAADLARVKTLYQQHGTITKSRQ